MKKKRAESAIPPQIKIVGYPCLISPKSFSMKSDYFNMDFQKSKQVSGNAMVLGKYAGASQNQNPYDLIANYSPQAQELLKKWVRLALVPTKSRGKKVKNLLIIF